MRPSNYKAVALTNILDYGTFKGLNKKDLAEDIGINISSLGLAASGRRMLSDYTIGLIISKGTLTEDYLFGTTSYKDYVRRTVKEDILENSSEIIKLVKTMIDTGFITKDNKIDMLNSNTFIEGFINALEKDIDNYLE